MTSLKNNKWMHGIRIGRNMSNAVDVRGAELVGSRPTTATLCRDFNPSFIHRIANHSHSRFVSLSKEHDRLLPPNGEISSSQGSQ